MSALIRIQDMPKLIIGREAVSRNPRLRIQCQGCPDKFINVTVPQFVSREHLSVEWENDNITAIRISNLKEENRTTVDGRIITTCCVGSPNVDVKLGAEPGFRIDLANILSQTGFPYSIAHLKGIYERWHDYQLNEQIRERQFNAISSVTGILGSMSTLCIFIPDIPTAVRIALISLSIVLIVAFAVLRYKKSNAPIEHDRRRRQFEKEYACPKCGLHFGNISFDQLKIHGCCRNPNCKTRFTS